MDLNLIVKSHVKKVGKTWSALYVHLKFLLVKSLLGFAIVEQNRGTWCESGQYFANHQDNIIFKFYIPKVRILQDIVYNKNKRKRKP